MFNWKQKDSSLPWNNRVQSGEGLVSPEVGRREAPGVRRSVRRTYHDWMFLDRDPEEFRKDESLPIGVESALKDVFGERAKNLKVAMHPHLRRWCLYERHRDPALGKDDMWQTIWICCEAPEDGKIPSDYVGDRFLESFGKFVGEFRLPHKQDFIEIEEGDKKKYGVDAVWRMFDKRYNKERDEAEKELRDSTEDFCDYYFNQAVNDANQAAGSGQRMQSYATVKLFSDPEKWYNAERNGYTVRVRAGTRMEKRLQVEDEIKAKWGPDAEMPPRDSEIWWGWAGAVPEEPLDAEFLKRLNAWMEEHNSTPAVEPQTTEALEPVLVGVR